MYNKKGVSGIVVSLIMIAIVLGAIAILWGVLQNFIGEGEEQIILGKDCLNVNIEVTKLICDGTTCSVTFERNPGGNDIAGIKIIFTNSAGESNYVHDYSETLNVLDTKTISDIETGISSVNKVEIFPYFNDSSGNEALCENPSDTFESN